MIEEITLTNWKSFGQSKLYIEPLTFVIGYNASGKSNILDAMDYLSQVSNGSSLSDAAKAIRGGDGWVVKEGENQAALGVKAYDEDNKIYYDYCISFDAQFQIVDEYLTRTLSQNNREYTKDLFKLGKTPSETDASFSVSLPGRKPVDLDRRKSALFQLGMTKLQKDVEEGIGFVLGLLRKIFILDPIPGKMRDYSTFEQNLSKDASNIAGVIAGKEAEEKFLLEKRIAEIVRPLPERDIMAVWAETVGTFKKDAILCCKEQWTEGAEGMLLDARGMSDGTLRFIAIVTALLTLPAGTLLLVEEVDNGLHPSRSNELVRALRSLGKERGIDVVCTTHNPYLIDTLGPDMISRISYVRRNHQNGSSEIIPLDEHENLLKLMANGSIGTSMAEGRI
ncbi:MAG: AAA family ATPase [Bacteroidales bacterium]|nr:AAA family ATPase [Bacteroidales bacterium]